MNYDDILYLMANAFRIYVIFRFIKTFFDYDDMKNIRVIVSFIAFFLINSAVYLLLPNQLLNLTTNILLLFLITCWFNSRILIKIVTTLSVNAVNMFAEFAISKAINKEYVISSSGLAVALSVVTLELLWEYCKKFKYTDEIRGSHLLALILIPLCCIFIGTITIQDANFNTVIISAFLLIINIMVFYLYDNIVRSYSDMHEKSTLEQQNKAYINQIKIVYDSQRAMQYYRHDIKNHLYKMQDMIENKEYEKLIEYIGESIEYMKLGRKVIESGNPDIDSLLNYKLRDIDEQNIKLDTKFILPHELFINTFDMNIVLGNLIDNALEALKYCTDKKLTVHLTYCKGVMFITIKNTFSNSLNFNVSDSGFLTTKVDSDKHGLGIQSVRYTIEKYDGTMEIETVGNIFSVKALMYNR